MTQLHPHQEYVIDEFAHDYLEHKLGRRELLHRVLMITGSVPVTASVLLALGCGDSDEDTAPAAQATTAPTQVVRTGPPTGPGVSETDPAIEARAVTFPGPASEMKAYLARPKANGTYPAVMIIHENAGLRPHFADVARRYAKEGFVGLAVDLVSRLGGTSDDTAKNMQALRASTEDFVADLQANLNYLKTQSFVKASALGVTGFCFGGGLSFQMAAKSPDVKASVPYYGFLTPELLEQLKTTKAAVQFFWGDQDRGVSAAAGVTASLQASGSPNASKIYPGAGHSFFNDTSMAYNKEAADDSWKLTLEWFRKYLV